MGILTFVSAADQQLAELSTFPVINAPELMLPDRKNSLSFCVQQYLDFRVLTTLTLRK